MTSSATACGACGRGIGRARQARNERHSASADIANDCFELIIMKVSDIKLRAEAVVLPK